MVGLAAALGGCPASEDAGRDPSVARVGTRSIPASALVDAIAARAGPGTVPRSGSGFEGLRDRVLKELAVDEVLLLEAAQRGVVVSDAAVTEAEAALVEPSDAATAPRLRRRLTLQAVERAVRQELAQGIDVPVEQVESARDRLGHLLRRPSRLRARQLFTTDAEVARVARQRLRDESWDAVVPPLQGDAGELGWMTADSAPVVLVEAVSGLEPGETTSVVRSGLGYHVFQLQDRTPPQMIEGAAALRILEDAVRAEVAETRFRAWLGGRVDAVGLDVDEAAVEAVRCCRAGLPFVAPEEER